MALLIRGKSWRHPRQVGQDFPRGVLAAALTSLAGSEWGPETGGKPEQYIQLKESDVAGHGGRHRFGGRYAFDGILPQPGWPARPR